MEKDKERIANIVCNTLNKSKCTNCNYKCKAYFVATALVDAGCTFIPKLIIERKPYEEKLPNS